MIKGTSIYRKANGKFMVVATVWSKDKQEWVRKSFGTFPTRGEANAEQERLKTNRHTFDDLARRAMTLGQLAEVWWFAQLDQELAAGNIARLTLEHYKGDVRRHLIPALGHIRVADLTQADVRAWVNSLGAGDWSSKPLASRTVIKSLTALRRMLADAGIEPNPAHLTRRRDRPKLKRTRTIVRPTAQEAKDFLVHTQNCESGRHLEALWRLAVEHGLRRAELCGLAWDDIDFVSGKLTIARSLQNVRQEVFVKEPKSVKGRRTHLMSAATMEALRRHRARLAEARLAAGGLWEAQPLGLDLVFRHDKKPGKPLTPARLDWLWRWERDCAGVKQGVTLHSFRHSNGSVLLANGLPLTEVANHLGIDLATAVMAYLGELDPEDRQRKVATIAGQVWG